MLKTLDVLGVQVSAINLEIASRLIADWIARDAREYVCITGVHGVMESQRDEELQQIHNRAGLVTPDGMPLVWLLRWAGYKWCDRVYGPDLMLSIIERGCRSGYRHFLYGSTEATLASMQTRLTRRFPAVEFVGTYAPPFRQLTLPESRMVVKRINDSGADLVWVGLSTPKQEFWMARFRPKLDAKVLIGVGAAFAFHAGEVRQAPRLVQRCGFEWAFRTCMEPRRLWKRYARNNPAFLAKIAVQMFSRRTSGPKSEAARVGESRREDRYYE